MSDETQNDILKWYQSNSESGVNFRNPNFRVGFNNLYKVINIPHDGFNIIHRFIKDTVVFLKKYRHYDDVFLYKVSKRDERMSFVPLKRDKFMEKCEYVTVDIKDDGNIDKVPLIDIIDDMIDDIMYNDMHSIHVQYNNYIGEDYKLTDDQIVAFYAKFEHEYKPNYSIDAETLNGQLRYIHGILARDGDKYYEYFINWLSHIVQKPASRMHTSIIITNDRFGNGGMLYHTLWRFVFGRGACHGNLPTQFDGGSSPLSIIKYNQYNESPDEMEKFIKAWIQPNYIEDSNGVVAHNFNNFIMVDDGYNVVRSKFIDPRMCVIRMNEDIDIIRCDKYDTHHYFFDYGVNLYHFLHRRDISNFNPSEIPQLAENGWPTTRYELSRMVEAVHETRIQHTIPRYKPYSEGNQPYGGYVYMVQSRDMASDVVKIGRGTEKRVKSYGSDADVIFNIKVDDMKSIEKELIMYFKDNFTLIRGNEYFRGDLDDMRTAFSRIVCR